MAALGLTPTGKGLTPDQIRELLGVLDRELGRAMDLGEPLTMLVVGRGGYLYAMGSWAVHQRR